MSIFCNQMEYLLSYGVRIRVLLAVDGHSDHIVAEIL